MVQLWNVEEGDCVRFGYGFGLFEWRGEVVSVDSEPEERDARTRHRVVVESDNGREFVLRAAVWYRPSTRVEPEEFAVDEYSIETDTGEKSRLTLLKTIPCD